MFITVATITINMTSFLFTAAKIILFWQLDLSGTKEPLPQLRILPDNPAHGQMCRPCSGPAGDMMKPRNASMRPMRCGVFTDVSSRGILSKKMA